MRSDESHGTTVKFLLTLVILVIAVGLLIYYLSSTSIFDASGGYISDMAKENSTAEFVEKAQSISYYDLITSEVEDYKDVALRYWGTITESDLDTDKSCTYMLDIVANQADSNKLKKLDKTKYVPNYKGYVTAPIIAEAVDSYLDFTVGDVVFVYGTLEEYREHDGYSKVPVLKVKKLEIDPDSLIEETDD